MTGPIVIVLGPIAILIALMIVVPMRRFGLLPSHGSAFWAGCLMTCMALGGLFASSTVWAFVVNPAQLQSALLGKQYGNPLTLRSYEQWGFQDQSQVWRYTLSPQDAAKLGARCAPHPAPAPSPSQCLISTLGDPVSNADGILRSASLEGKMLVVEEHFW